MFACLSEPLGLVWPRPDVVVHVAVGHPRRARKPMRGAIGVAPPGRTEASPDDANRVGRSASAGREPGGASVDATTPTGGVSWPRFRPTAPLATTR